MKKKTITKLGTKRAARKVKLTPRLAKFKNIVERLDLANKVRAQLQALPSVNEVEDTLAKIVLGPRVNDEVDRALFKAMHTAFGLDLQARIDICNFVEGLIVTPAEKFELEGKRAEVNPETGAIELKPVSPTLRGAFDTAAKDPDDDAFGSMG